MPFVYLIGVPMCGSLLFTLSYVGVWFGYYRSTDKVCGGKRLIRSASTRQKSGGLVAFNALAVFSAVLGYRVRVHKPLRRPAYEWKIHWLTPPQPVVSIVWTAFAKESFYALDPQYRLGQVWSPNKLKPEFVIPARRSRCSILDPGWPQSPVPRVLRFRDKLQNVESVVWLFSTHSRIIKPLRSPAC